jgi:indole-3-glycerol phosphate synthase
VNTLERILETTREEVARRRKSVPPAQVREAIAARGGERRPFAEALGGPGVALIAEHKRRSPSAGALREDVAVADVAAAYERGGAAALSVLTDGPHFGGSLEDLGAARAACALPLLRKDFVIDPYQVDEAAAAGADAVLLIVAALEGDELADLHGAALGNDLDVLVEVHDVDELERALEIDAQLIGINNRNLGDSSVDIRRTFELLADVPAGKMVVSESGYREREQISELERVGVDAVLVGESLMRASDPETAVRALSGRALDPERL